VLISGGIAARFIPELRALTPEIGNIPMLSFIDGLASIDITKPHIERLLTMSRMPPKVNHIRR